MVNLRLGSVTCKFGMWAGIGSDCQPVSMRCNPLSSYTEDENENGYHKTWLIYQDTLRCEFQDREIYKKAHGTDWI